MPKIRGFHRRRDALGLIVGALILPLVLGLTGEVSIAKACVLWSLSTAGGAALMIGWAYLRVAGSALADRYF